MIIKQIEVSRTFNCGNYESERISLTAEIGINETSIDSPYELLHESIEHLHKRGPYKGAGLRRKG